jgi:hypothetical protein
MQNTNAVLGLLGAKTGMSEFQISLMEAITLPSEDDILDKGVALCFNYQFPKGHDGVKEVSDGFLAMLVSSIGSASELVRVITLTSEQKTQSIVTAVFGLLKIGGYIGQEKFREDWAAKIKGDILTFCAEVVTANRFASCDLNSIHQGELSNLVAQFFRGRGFGASFGPHSITHDDSHTMAKLMNPFQKAVWNTPVPDVFHGIHAPERAFNVRLANELMSKYFLSLNLRNKVMALSSFVTGNETV